MGDNDYQRVQEIKAEIKVLEIEKCALFAKLKGKRMKQNMRENHEDFFKRNPQVLEFVD